MAAANLEPLQLVLLVETSIGIIKMASLLKAQKKQAAKLDAKGKRKAESMDVDEESSSPAKKRPRNKQRVLLLSSRGITHRMRHLMNDLEALLPQVKKGALTSLLLLDEEFDGSKQNRLKIGFQKSSQPHS